MSRIDWLVLLFAVISFGSIMGTAIISLSHKDEI